jgi:dTDP-4-dehydrorhamnose reductase
VSGECYRFDPNSALAAADLDSSGTLIIGRRGRLARAFASAWPQAQTAGKEEIDITRRAAVLASIHALRPRLMVNCAAITDMRACEDDRDAAWAVNVRGVRNLAEAAAAVGATLVHYSSDYATSPINEYAWTKRGSEAFAKLTIRGKIYDGSHWAWTALRRGQPIKMATSEYSNPITTTETVAMTAELLGRGCAGLVNVGTAERLNFHEIGRSWASALGAPEELVIPIDEVPSSMPRLKEMFLPLACLSEAGIQPRTVADDAARHLGSFA